MIKYFCNLIRQQRFLTYLLMQKHFCFLGNQFILFEDMMQILPWLDDYLLLQKMIHWLITSRDINDHTFLQSDWMRVRAFWTFEAGFWQVMKLLRKTVNFNIFYFRLQQKKNRKSVGVFVYLDFYILTTLKSLLKIEKTLE